EYGEHPAPADAPPGDYQMPKEVDENLRAAGLGAPGDPAPTAPPQTEPEAIYRELPYDAHPEDIDAEVQEDVLDPLTREGLEGFTQGSLEGLGVVPPPPPPTPMRQHWRAAGQMLMVVLAMVAGGAMAVGGTGLAVGAGWTGVG